MNNGTNVQKRHVKLPIRRSLLLMMIIMFAVLCVLIFIVSRVYFEKNLYVQFDSKLAGVITYVENNIDADDMKKCLQTGEPSEKYNKAQLFLNNMIDDLGFKYIYIVIPKETTMVNVISATSAEEFAAGDDNLPLLDEGEWYTPEVLAKYRSFWDADGINYFDETDTFEGVAKTRHVGCKPLRDSAGETIALICADLESDELRAAVSRSVILSIITVAAVFAVFGIILGIWLHRYVTSPLRALESSAHKFASGSEDEELRYDAPEIKLQNEVGSLASAIKKMTDDISVYLSEKEAKDIMIRIAEEENIRLAEKAASSAKIAELSQSVSDLLNNMPALTFYKDTDTGKYLGCNQAFATYAGKNDPSEIIGLTDYDLFTKENADHFVEVDKKTMELDYPYVILETATDAAGVARTFQTTKLKFKDASGEERLLGMCMDLTEMTSAKRETEKAQEAYEEAMSSSITYSGIARALAMDYTYIYYVNILTEEFIEFRSTDSTEALTVEKRGKDFFETSRREAENMLYKDDRDVFVSAFTKENVLEKIDRSNSFTFTYRLMIDGEPTYVNMKATRIKGDPQHIIIGVYNVDAQMKYKESLERLQEERTTYSRITALSGDYICIYTVDPLTEHYMEYIVKGDYEGLNLAKEGDNFFARSREDSLRVIWPEDQEMFASVMTRENVLKEIKEHGLFTLNYRLTIKGEPVYVSLKAAIVEEKDGPQIIVGVSNIDAQVKREHEYDYNLSVARSQANIDALTGVKNKHAYIDAEAELNTKIEEGEPVEFALVVFDVNGLKIVNDTMGHRAGDDLIRGACSIICGEFKHSPVFRVGGDEFAVIVTGEDYANIDALVKRIEEINLKNKENNGINVACGMARFNNERSVAEVFEKADSAMYENKRMLKSK